MRLIDKSGFAFTCKELAMRGYTDKYYKQTNVELQCQDEGSSNIDI